MNITLNGRAVQDIIRGMQIKKVDWINRPERVRITSRTLCFRESGKRAALYTVGENEELTLRYEGENVSFLMLHTDRDYLRICSDRIAFSMHGTKSVSYGTFGTELEVVKEGTHISFLQDGRTVFEAEDPAYKDSASLGFFIEGSEKDVTLFFA